MIYKISVLFLIIISAINMNAQELSVFQGFWGPQYFEDDRQISRSEFGDKLISVPESKIHFDRYKSTATVSGIASIIGSGGAVWWALSDSEDSRTAPITMTIAGFGIGSVFGLIASKHQKNAILSYNKNTTVGYRVSPSKEGVGLTVHF